MFFYSMVFRYRRHSFQLCTFKKKLFFDMAHICQMDLQLKTCILVVRSQLCQSLTKSNQYIPVCTASSFEGLTHLNHIQPNKPGISKLFGTRAKIWSALLRRAKAFKREKTVHKYCFYYLLCQAKNMVLYK